MDEDKTILFNYLLSLNDKTSEVLSDKNNQKDTLIDENTKKENKYNDDIYSLNFIDNTNQNLENDNRKKNESLLPLDNEISKDTKTTLLKDISYKDKNKRNFSSKNKLETKNSIFKVDNDYKTLKSIIDSGLLKYYEQEYSLYFVGKEYVEAYSDCYYTLTFNWNSFEYNMKYKDNSKKLIKKQTLYFF